MELKIGPILTIHRPDAEGYLPNLVDALAADNERGSHHLNNLAAEQLKREWPTVLAMADLIEKQRDALLAFVEGVRNPTPDEVEIMIKKIKQGSY